MTDLEQLRVSYLKCEDEAAANALAESCNSSEAFISIHNENAVYLSGSKNIKAITGHASEDLIGQSGYDYFHPDDYKDIFMSHAKTTMKDGISTVSYRYRKADGTYLAVISLSKQLKTSAGVKFILVLTMLG